jgi:hypothetical protein
VQRHGSGVESEVGGVVHQHRDQAAYQKLLWHHVSVPSAGQLRNVQKVRDSVISDLQQAFQGYPAKDRFLQARPDIDLPGEMVENPGTLTFLHIGPAARFQDETGRARPTIATVVCSAAR